MWKLIDTKQLDVLKMTQDNLETTQKNNQMLSEILINRLTSTPQTAEVCEKTAEEKLRAAYALNLCTVSVSQIIDYNDIYFLEREYDAILNNLNLEKMPKDDALLRILKQLLDVITFFRIQDGERKMMEKEYNHKIKNAIWAAVPNPSMIIAGGNLLSIAISLASQIGTGYMNYRKEKAQIALEQERKEWELQRSAIEQFNGLRRELFDTAWRLADEYNFPDEYRITERQISQYNDILLDTNDLRRYERLEYISNKFKAYPPFWYNLGNAANLVYQDKRHTKEIREKFKALAYEHFNYFFAITKDNILREDQLVASCALEMFDLIDDKVTKISLLEKAQKASGNSLDVLQLCAISYLKIGETDKACDLLNMLVNENYNEIINGQLLSKLYVSKFINGDTTYKGKYDMLVSRFSDSDYLFPFPTLSYGSESDNQELSSMFILKQIAILKKSYANALSRYIYNCQSQYNSICKQNGNITTEMAELIKNMIECIGLLCENSAKIAFKRIIKKNLDANNNNFNKMLEMGSDRNRGNYVIKFETLFREPFMWVAKTIVERLSTLSEMSEISYQETNLYNFIVKSDIETTCYVFNENTYSNSIEEIFGDSYLINLKRSQALDKFKDLIGNKNYSESTLFEQATDKFEFLVHGTVAFNAYITKVKKSLNKYEINEDTVFAVLNDKHHMNDIDLIFTTDGIVVDKLFSMSKVNYKNISFDAKGKKLVIGNHKYDSKHVNPEELDSMIKEFAKLYNMLQDSSDNPLAKEVIDIITS